jgi:transposase
MAMGKRKRGRQEELWVETQSLPKSPGHPFYERLNRVLSSHGFDEYVEELCTPFYSPDKRGRPSVAPGVYFRMLLIGYFEGLDSERAIAWRCADSLALRSFLGYSLEERPADHSTVSRTRRLIDVETHGSVFSWVLGVLLEEGLVSGKTIGIDATTLEANAALRSIVRRDTGESYDEFLTSLAKASGIATPTRGDLAKLDRKRSKKGSNDDWKNPHDPDAQITKMKDGRTHLAHKAEHAVDLDSGAVLSVTLQGGAKGDTTSVWQTLAQTERNLTRLGENWEEGVHEVVTDKGYHSNAVLLELQGRSYRTYVSEPDRGRRNWSGKQDAQEAVYGNRRRIRGDRGKRLLRRRGELLERPFAHYLDSGGMRRTHLRRHENILKRLLIQVAGCNLGLLMRKLVGRGTPRGLHAACRTLSAAIWARYRAIVVRLAFRPRRMGHLACPHA